MAYSDDEMRAQSNTETLESLESLKSNEAAPLMKRRELAQLAALASGALAVDAMLPQRWISPVLQLGFLPAHAQASGGLTLDVHHLPPGVRPGTEPPSANGTSGTSGGSAGSGGMGGSGGSGGMSGSGGDGASGTSAPAPTGTTGLSAGKGSPGAGDPCKGTTPPVPGLPSTLGASNFTPTSVTISWNPNGGTHFTLLAEPVYPSASGEVVSASAIGSSQVLSGLSPCTSYRVRVTGVECGVAGSYTDYFFETPPNLSPAATGLTLKSQDCTSAVLTWASASNCSPSYQIEISSDDGTTWHYGGSASDYNRTVTLTGLCPGEVWLVRVRAYAYSNSYGYVYSQFSNIVSVAFLRNCDNPSCAHSDSPSNGSSGIGGDISGPKL